MQKSPMLPKQSPHFEPIRKELEEVRLKFLRLLDEISDSAWNFRTPGEGWTVKQEMAHIAQVLSVLPDGIRRASRGRQRSIQEGDLMVNGAMSDVKGDLSKGVVTENPVQTCRWLENRSRRHGCERGGLWGQRRLQDWNLGSAGCEPM